MSVRESVVQFIVEKPWRALLAGFVVFMACAAGGQHIAPDFSYRVWFNEDDPLIEEFDAFERRFGNDDRAVVIVHSPSGIFDKESAQLLLDLTEAAWKAPEVIRVDSLSNFNWVHSEEGDYIVEPLIPPDMELTDQLLAQRKAAALAHETLPDYLVSRDGTAALMYVTVKPALGGSPDYEAVLEGGESESGQPLKGLREIAKEFEKGDHRIMITGGPVINHSFKEAAEYDIANILPLVFGLTLLFLAIMFRRVSGVLIPIAVIVTSVGAAMGLGGWFGYSINNMTSIVPQILVAIAVADSVHILVSFYRALSRGLERKASAIYTLDKNFVPTLLTSASTAIGFFSFSQAEVVPIGQLGTLAGIGTLLAWVFTYFVVGPLLTLLPFKTPKKVGDADELKRPSDRSLRAVRGLARRRRPILVFFVLLGGATVFLAAQTRVNSDPFNYFSPESDMNQATTFLEDKVGGATTVEVVLDSGVDHGFKNPDFLARVAEFQTWLEGQEYVTSNNSLVDILKSMNRSFNDDQPEFYQLPVATEAEEPDVAKRETLTRERIAQLYFMYTASLPSGMDLNDRVSVKEDAIRMTSAWNIHDSATVLAKIDEVEAKAKSMGLNAHVTGKFQLWQAMNPYVVRTFVVSISVAVFLMSVLMVIVFRSVKLGMLAMLPNVFPLLFGAALIKLIGQDLDMGTVLAFSFCLGIAVDDTVHFMANFASQRRAGRSAEEAIASIFTHTVPALAITTIVLVVGFGAFMLSTFLPNKFFGIFVAFILSLALITDLTFLPALLLGDKSKTVEGDVTKSDIT